MIANDIVNIGNMQIGNGNTMNTNNSDIDNIYWAIFDNILFDNNRKCLENPPNAELLNEAEENLKNRDKKGLCNLYKKYGTQFISTVFSNVASEEIIKLLSWICK